MQNYEGERIIFAQFFTVRNDAVLTQTQIETLRAAVDRIVPPDAETPGGVEAGAFDYLLVQLGGDLAGEVPNYRAFLDWLEGEATGGYGASFVNLPPEAQTDLLRKAEADEAQRRFFGRFVEQTQEGFYISPIAWDMIGWKVRG